MGGLINSCIWTRDCAFEDVYWDTKCGKSFIFVDGGTPKENDFIFCPYCGKPIVTKEERKYD